jgi:hypothetical protein
MKLHIKNVVTFPIQNMLMLFCFYIIVKLWLINIERIIGKTIILTAELVNRFRHLFTEINTLEPVAIFAMIFFF